MLGPLVLAGGFYFTTRSFADARRNRTFDFYLSFFEKFYDLSHLDRSVRIDFEYRFFDEIAPLMEKWLVYPEFITNKEMMKFVGIDALLNFFELVAHASNDRRFLGASKFRQIMFTYWFDMMKDDSHAILERYFSLSFETLRKRVGFFEKPVLLATYGTLMTGHDNPIPDTIQARLKSCGACYIPGHIFEIAEEKGNLRYPGLVRSTADDQALVTGELFEIGLNDTEAAVVLRALDPYERFHPDDVENSLFRRRYIAIYGSDQKIKHRAWVYIYNRPAPVAAPIPGGDWDAFCREAARD
jgi:gamma-glutamylcyclotransferase (GGCT)/AIG2-like uncharacterized protein YtfP